MLVNSRNIHIWCEILIQNGPDKLEYLVSVFITFYLTIEIIANVYLIGVVFSIICCEVTLSIQTLDECFFNQINENLSNWCGRKGQDDLVTLFI